MEAKVLFIVQPVTIIQILVIDYYCIIIIIIIIVIRIFALVLGLQLAFVLLSRHVNEEALNLNELLLLLLVVVVLVVLVLALSKMFEYVPIPNFIFSIMFSIPSYFEGQVGLHYLVCFAL
jgi:hypothetical protein